MRLLIGSRPAVGRGLLNSFRPYTRHPLQRRAPVRDRRLLHLLPKADAKEGKEIERTQSLKSDKLWENLEKNALSNFLEKPRDNKRKAMQQKQRAAPLGAKPPQQGWAEAVGERWSRTLYAYFNYRTGSVNDLGLLILLNISIVLLGGVLRHFLVHKELPGGATPTLGQDLYRVLLLLSFANGMPGAEDTLLERAFSLTIAGSGLIAFALTVALVQQSVRGAIEANVQTGGSLFEIDHMVVMLWGESQRDIEMVTQILEQVCLAYKADGGRTVAVLSSRPKLEMEAIFASTIPLAKRQGSRFLFRQGSPLLPESLAKVGAQWAQAIIVVADSSRCPDEADAQSLRAAVLLDEMDRPPRPGRGSRAQIVVEAKTVNVLRLLQAACSRRIIAVPTTQVAARRLARMVQHPAVADVSKALWSFASPSQVFLDSFPGLRGVPFGDLALRFDDGLVLGFLNRRTGRCEIAPPAATPVGEDDDLIMMRPTGLAPGTYQPMPAPLPASIGDWKPSQYERRRDTAVGIRVSRSSMDADEEPPLNLAHEDEDSSDQNGAGPLAWLGQQVQDRLRLGSSSGNGAQHGASSNNGDGSSSRSSGSVASLDEPPKGDGIYYIASPEFTGGLGNHEIVLICGWQDTPFMLELLRELDRGTGALPKGSEVVLLNAHEGEDVAAALKKLGRCRNIALRHLQGNPLHKDDLKKVDMGALKCAVVLCDTLWRDPGAVAVDAENSGCEHLAAEDYLRLDAMILVTQLNIRTALDEMGRPDINIVCEKVAFHGLTRFEDRHALPLGVSSNFTAYSAKLLTQVAYDAKALAVYSRLNGACDLIVQDASSLAAQNELLSFADLQLRAQAVDQVLLGYREIPKREEAIISVLNPPGFEERTTPRVWNEGDGCLKLVTYRRRAQREGDDQRRGNKENKEGGREDEDAATRKRAVERV